MLGFFRKELDESEVHPEITHQLQQKGNHDGNEVQSHGFQFQNSGEKHQDKEVAHQCYECTTEGCAECLKNCSDPVFISGLSTHRRYRVRMRSCAAGRPGSSCADSYTAGVLTAETCACVPRRLVVLAALQFSRVPSRGNRYGFSCLREIFQWKNCRHAGE